MGIAATKPTVAAMSSAKQIVDQAIAGNKARGRLGEPPLRAANAAGPPVTAYSPENFGKSV